MKQISHLLLGLAVSGMLIFTFLVPDAQLFMEPSLARILFTHVPCAFLASIFIVSSAFFAGSFVRKGTDVAAAKMHASIELGTIFAALTMATGILFSKIQWGAWWHNDPRQISFLIVLFFYAALMALRGAYNDRGRMDRSTAWLSISLVLPAIFLMFVFPRLKFVEQKSFHPTRTIPEGQLDFAYSFGLWGTLVVLGWLALMIFSLRQRVELAERALDDNYGHDETGSRGSAPDGVVRPVAVSEKD